MSNFPKNLSILRRCAGYTQESLAEALDVSRQAVSKWESGAAMPEAATLIALADLLHCTLDALMREELSEEAVREAARSEAEELADNEAAYALFEAYNTHMNRFSWMIAAGVALILAGVATILAAYGLWGERPIIVLPFFLCLAVSVFLFVSGGIAYSDFQKRCPEVPELYLPEEIAQFRRTFRRGISLSISAILADVGILVALCVLFERDRTMLGLSIALFFLILAAAVGAIVYLGIQYSKHDPKTYSEEAIRAADPDKKDFTGAIMLLATAVFLILGFCFRAWHPGWLVFPVAALLSGAVEDLQKKK